jgi:hypothetical protein
LIVLDIVNKKINSEKYRLAKELHAQAQDPVIAMRRFRMLSQLADYEAQIIAKIWRFTTSNFADYFSGLNSILLEIDWMVDRSG